ncbi:hypothetical protein [Kribbella sp. C-35]|uniref:hypothetical protein n=1 Tax=Kribbella sp. C-35 TaxID=2789276 RepID=UPI00397B53D4
MEATQGRDALGSPSISRSIDEPQGSVTAYLEILAATKSEVERCPEAVLLSVRAQGILAAGPLTILSIDTGG